MQKKKIFETFNDGMITLYERDEYGKAAEVKGRFRFGYQTVGSRRFYDAQSVKVKVDELIRIPLKRELLAGLLAETKENRYEVKQVQHIPDSLPPKTLLTLEAYRGEF